jgi:hypothetical protein
VRPDRLPLVVWLASAALLAGGCDRSASGVGSERTGGARSAVPEALVAWESNRSGGYRIWLVPLRIDGVRIEPGEPRRLSPEEAERDHCCPALSPDGARLLYASHRRQSRHYLPREAPVELRLVDLASGRSRLLSATARLNGENRAAVWWGPAELVYLEGDGSTRRLDLALGADETLVPASAGGGWLVAPGGRHATRAEPTFSERDPATGAIRLAPLLGGCQPIFTADGEFGLWTAGAGGPLDVVDLATRAARSIVRRGDARLPAGRRYLYFPAIANDRSLLAWAASDGAHDHFRADYDLFVAPLDPETLDLAGGPVAVAPHPAVDRYPDLWRLAPPRPPRAAPTAAPARALETRGVEAGAPLFLWRRATGENRRTPEADSETLDLAGAAWYDRLGRLALAGGLAAARADSAARVDSGLRSTNGLSLALLVEPAGLGAGAQRPLPLVALGRSARSLGFTLRQRGAAIELWLRTGESGPAGTTAALAALPDGAPHHLALRFSPGRLASFLDGRAARTTTLPGDFFHWRNERLLFGAEPGSEARFRGWLAEVAIWDRELTDAELAAEAERALGRLRSAPPVARHRVRARLLARSRPPALDEISPYRSALAVDEFELVDRFDAAAGALPPRLRVARWALLDAAPAPAARLPIGATVELLLEPYAAQPQLESVVVADTLPPSPVPLLVDVGLD